MNSSYSSLQFLLTYDLSHLKIVIIYNEEDLFEEFESVNEWMTFLSKNISYQEIPFSVNIFSENIPFLKSIADSNLIFFENRLISNRTKKSDPYKFVAEILAKAILKTNVIRE